MAKISVTIDTPAGVDPFSIANDSKRTKLRALAYLLRNFASATFLGHPTLRAGTAAATGTVTCASVSAADTVTINGVVFTATAGTADPGEFSIDGDNTADAVSLVAAINTSASPIVSNNVSASNLLGVVTLTAKTKGTPGNANTLASSNGTRLLTSGARLTGGTDTTFSF